MCNETVATPLSTTCRTRPAPTHLAHPAPSTRGVSCGAGADIPPSGQAFREACEKRPAFRLWEPNTSTPPTPGAGSRAGMKTRWALKPRLAVRWKGTATGGGGRRRTCEVREEGRWHGNGGQPRGARSLTSAGLRHYPYPLPSCRRCVTRLCCSIGITVRGEADGNGARARGLSRLSVDEATCTSDVSATGSTAAATGSGFVSVATAASKPRLDGIIRGPVCGTCCAVA